MDFHSGYVISKSTLSDLDKIQCIGRTTFSETFAGVNSKENMKEYLDEHFNFEKLTIEMTDTNSEFYLVSSGNKTIAYLKINHGQAQTELKDSNALEIERIYVLKDFHGNKVGQLLFDKAIEIAKEKKVHYLWLGVWGNNKRAINFYKKNGFIEFDKHIFKLGESEQTDLMMKKDLC